MPQTRQIFAHDVWGAGNVVGFREEAEVALVDAAETKQVGSGTYSTSAG